jgi:hypothetical protein
MPAELALAILGVALAWKGILDFGQLISKMTDDDDRKREVLALSLEVSQCLLIEWGDHWGVGRANGRFHNLAREKKDLIVKIIFQLRDSRERAIKRLRRRYHKCDEEEHFKSEPTEGRLSRMVESFVAMTKRSKLKTLWLMGDKDLVESLVEETMRLHGYLDRLTYMSVKFLSTHIDNSRAAPPLECSLATMEDRVKRYNPKIITSTNQLSAASTPQDIDTIDDQTLACYATDPIIPSKQRERILQRIDIALDYHGDSRVPETVTAWWNSTRSDLLLLELSDDMDDETGTSTCVLVYYLVKCCRLIFMFDAQSSKEPFLQLLDMLKTFFQSLISSRGNKPLDGLSLPISITEMENQAVDNFTMQQLIEIFHKLLRDVLENSDMPVLLIVDGLDTNRADDRPGLAQLVHCFVSGLQEMCEMDNRPHGAIFKALIAHKGRARSLYKSITNSSIVDLTDYAPHISSFKEDLALFLYN